jgi:hypothetical protein
LNLAPLGLLSIPAAAGIATAGIKHLAEAGRQFADYLAEPNEYIQPVSDAGLTETPSDRSLRENLGPLRDFLRERGFSHEDSVDLVPKGDGDVRVEADSLWKELTQEWIQANPQFVREWSTFSQSKRIRLNG